MDPICSTCHLPQNKPHNGHLAALFPEVTHKDFSLSELEYTAGFDREEIHLSLISPWEKFVAYLLRVRSEN